MNVATLPRSLWGDPGECKSDLILELAARNGLPIITITANAQEHDIMGKPNTTPSMDQLWDRLPDESETLEPEALQRWANSLSPKARAAILAALNSEELNASCCPPVYDTPGIGKTLIVKDNDNG